MINFGFGEFAKERQKKLDDAEPVEKFLAEFTPALRSELGPEQVRELGYWIAESDKAAAALKVAGDRADETQRKVAEAVADQERHRKATADLQDRVRALVEDEATTGQSRRREADALREEISKSLHEDEVRAVRVGQLKETAAKASGEHQAARERNGIAVTELQHFRAHLKCRNLVLATDAKLKRIAALGREFGKGLAELGIDALLLKRLASESGGRPIPGLIEALKRHAEFPRLFTGELKETTCRLVIQRGANVPGITVAPWVETTDPNFRPEGLLPGDAILVRYGTDTPHEISGTPAPRNVIALDSPLTSIVKR
jgi:hypothetical protein